MIERIRQIMDRVAEIRHRFHLDAPSRAAFGQPPASFAQELSRQSALAPWGGPGAVAPPQNTLKPYAETPAASGEAGRRAAQWPGVPPVAAPTPQGHPPAARSQPPGGPPPLPALPFDTQLEPYLPSMQTTPLFGAGQGGSALPQGVPPSLPALSTPVPGLQLNRLPLPGVGLAQSPGDLSGAGQGEGTSQGLGQSLDWLGRVATWDRALRAYTNNGSFAASKSQGVPFLP